MVKGGSEKGRERRAGRETRTSLRAVEGVWVQETPELDKGRAEEEIWMRGRAAMGAIEEAKIAGRKGILCQSA